MYIFKYKKVTNKKATIISCFCLKSMVFNFVTKASDQFSGGYFIIANPFS